MAYEKQTWISYDDNKTEEQNIKDGAVVTAERMNHIEDGVEAQATKIEFDAHLDDKENPHEVTAHQVGALTAEETSANVIYQIVGKKEVEMTFKLDFENKISGSEVENPNILLHGAAPTLPDPTVNFSESQTLYDNAAKLDGKLASFSNKTNGNIARQLVKYKILDFLKKELGDNYFSAYNSNDLESQVALIRSKITALSGSVNGFGLGPSGSKLTIASRQFVHDNEWRYSNSSTSNVVTKITSTVSQATIYAYINDAGEYQNVVYAEASDGNTASTVNIDYANAVFKYKLSMHEFIEKMIAAYSGENIDKKFVGLENVDNYGTATQAEAESGTATDKFMTPLRTKQHVSSRIATQTEAEGGTSSEKLMTPLRLKQHVDKRIATQAEVTDGEANDKLLSPKGLADTIKFTEVFLPGSTLSNVAIEGTLVPHGNTAGGSLNYIKNRPYTVNSDGSFTFKRATNLLVTGGMKLVVGDTNPTDYLYVNAYVNNALNEFIALGATAATNGTLRLAWSAMGQRVISVNSGDVLSLKIGLRSGKQAFAVQLTSLKIEEV